MFRKILQVLVLALVFCSAAFAQSKTDNKAAEHTLGPGDVIRVTVYQNPDLTTETRISEQGQITFPLIGAVNIGGLSVGAAQDRIAKQLRDGSFVIKPQVALFVTQVRSSQISILGQVAKPGRYPIEAVNSKVSEMIAAAGGVVPGGADVVSLSGTRDGKPIKLQIDLPAILQAGNTTQDMTVVNGDILFVDRAPSYYIYGEVQRPGVFRLERGTTLMQALAQGGGLTARGTERGMKVHRRDVGGVVHVLDLKLNDPVVADDVIYVRESIF